MKKLFAFVAALLSLLSFTACVATSEGAVLTDDRRLSAGETTENPAPIDDKSSTDADSSDNAFVFTKAENGNLVSSTGVEYARLAHEGSLHYLGFDYEEKVFVGAVIGEPAYSQHLGMDYKTGMFAIKGDTAQDILIRIAPNDEWFHFYRKTDLPPLDCSADNCIRLEFVPATSEFAADPLHATCGEGITDPEIIAEFLSDIRAQQNPEEAGLYDLARKPNGYLDNCYAYGDIYGFFEGETNLVIKMHITSYNDLAYSVDIEGQSYVLPDRWLEKLENSVSK